MAITPIQTRYNELLAFFKYWVPLYGQCDFFLYGQAAPRQNKPYVTANIFSSIETIGTLERRVLENGSEIVRSQFEITSQLFAFSNSSDRYSTEVVDNTCFAILQELKTSLRYVDVYDRLSNITCRLISEEPVTDVTQLLSTTFEPQATCSLTFSTVVENSVDNGAIETMDIEGTVEGSNNDITVDVSIT